MLNRPVPVRRRTFRGAMLTLLAAALGACGGGGTDVVVDAGSMTISLPASAGSITAGSSTTFGISIARTGSFSGAVDLTVEGLPTGVTATVSPSQLTSGATSATVNVTAAASAAAGASTLTIRARATGQADKTASFTLTVQPAAVTGGFTLSLAPASLSIAAGANNTSTVTIARTGTFTGAVNLAVSGAPAGVTATLSSATVAGNTATLTVAVAAGTAASTGTITVTGSATGVSNATASLGLTTTAVSPGAGNIVFRFCEAPFPVWFAYQDGTGAWTKVTGSNNTYSFDINAATGGVAYATTSGATANTSVYYGTKAEITARGTYNCPTAVGKTITGTMLGLSGQDQGVVTLGNKSTTVVAAAGTAWTLNGVPDGPHDLIAGRSTLTINGTSFSSSLAKVIIRRAQNPAAGTALAALDFASDGFVPGTATATINNLGSDQSIMTGLFTTANGTNGLLYADIGAGGASRTFYGVPASQTIAGDLGYIQATALNPGYISDPLLAATSRSAGVFFSTLGNQTLTLGPALSTPAVTTAATAPYVRLRNVLQRQAEYNQFFYVSFQQAGASPRNVMIEATVGFVGTGAFDVTIPDFTAAGYDASWGLKTGVNTIWVDNVSGWAAGTGVVTQTSGATVQNAAKAGQLTP